MKAIAITLIGCLWMMVPGWGQSISASIPFTIDTSQTFVFYLHGAIKMVNGKGVSAYYGVYEYQRILDTLKRHGYQVISEARPEGTDDQVYAKKVSKQVDTLLHAGVKPGKIVLIGASAGAYITIDVAIQQKNRHIKYAILGMCREDTYKSYLGKDICGNFLSIYESSDPHTSCMKLLEDKRCKTSVQEIRLTMNNSHAFLYQPYPEWVDPLVQWIGKKD